jgi:hypothetical protein
VLFNKKSLFGIRLTLVLAFAFLLIPVCSANFEAYQRINVNDTEGGQTSYVYTISAPNERLESFLTVHNMDSEPHNYIVNLNFPEFLSLDSGIEYYDFKSQDWKILPNSNINFEIFLKENSFVYIRFFVKVEEGFPNENVILSFWSSIKSDTGKEKKVANKIYIPNYTPTKPLEDKYKETSENEEYVRALLEEESRIIEGQFLKLMSKKVNNIQKENLIDVEKNIKREKETESSIRAIIFILITLTILAFYLRHHEKNN